MARVDRSEYAAFLSLRDSQIQAPVAAPRRPQAVRRPPPATFKSIAAEFCGAVLLFSAVAAIGLSFMALRAPTSNWIPVA